MVSSILLVNLQDTKAAQATAENTWQALQSLPETFSGTAVTIDDKIYIFSSNQKYITRFFVYDTVSQTLNETASMIIQRKGCGLAVIGQKIYIIGGQHSYPLEGGAIAAYPTNVTEAYDTQTGTWETKQPTIESANVVMANAVNGKIYAMTYSYMDVYDPEADNWTRISALPQDVSYPSCSCAIDDKIYVITDNTAATTIGEGNLHIYDTTTDAWSTGANLPTFYKQSLMVATTGEHAPKQIYLVGGAIRHLSPFGDFEAVNATFSYDPVSDSWSRAADMPTARHSAAVAIVADRIYALGGTIQAYWLSPSQTGAVEVYTPFGYVAEQPSASPSNGPESSQPDPPEATAVIAGVVVGAAVAGTAIAATAILVYRHKHLKTFKQNKPN